MSLDRRTALIEPQPGQWYFVSEYCDEEAPSQDWRTTAWVSGPLPSQALAAMGLRQRHGNPGAEGDTLSHADFLVGGHAEDPVWSACIRRAHRIEPHQMDRWRGILQDQP